MCSGPCVGTGVGYQIMHSPCEVAGDPAMQARVRDAAKAKAFAYSQAFCSGENCECYGDYRALIPEQCVPIKDAQGNDVCLYFAAYSYEGECSILI